MGRELKKYRIRATKKPAKSTLLSSTVVVRNESGKVGYCYINFDQPLIDAAGKALPRGLTVDDPAYLEVVYYPAMSVWLVKARYLLGDKEVLLWKTEQKPSWLNFYSRS